MEIEDIVLTIYGVRTLHLPVQMPMSIATVPPDPRCSAHPNSPNLTAAPETRPRAGQTQSAVPPASLFLLFDASKVPSPSSIATRRSDN